MPTASLPALSSLRQQVLRIVGRRGPGRRRLQHNIHLVRELWFDLLDAVDVLLDLEQCFHFPIPDEVPFVTVGDVVECMVAETQRPGRR